MTFMTKVSVSTIAIFCFLSAALQSAPAQSIGGGRGLKPLPQSPQIFIDTTWNPPAGHIWYATTSAQLNIYLFMAQPGDTIVLTAGATYSGNFTLLNKANPNGKWIYIQSSALNVLPTPGNRVSPSEVANMATITTPNTSAPISLAPGANHYRLIGLEITSNSTRGGNNNNIPPSNNFTYCLVCWSPASGLAEPDSITIDRDYIHGSATQDVGQGVQANGSNFAVIDSYISDIHESTFDSQAILAFWTPGPIKIVNNYLSRDDRRRDVWRRGRVQQPVCAVGH